MQEKSTDINQIEQLKNLIINLEYSVHNKVEALAGKIASSTTKKTTSNFTGVKMDLLSQQLDDLDKQIEKKLAGMVKTMQDIEDDLKTQVSAVRRQLQALPELDSPVEVEAKTSTPSKTTTKSKPSSSSTTSRSKATTTKTTARKTKANSVSQVEPEVPIDDYDTKSLRQLKKIAQERKLRGYARMKRPEILKALREADAAAS